MKASQVWLHPWNFVLFGDIRGFLFIFLFSLALDGTSLPASSTLSAVMALLTPIPWPGADPLALGSWRLTGIQKVPY